MTDAEEARWTGIFCAHPVAARVTVERVADALADYPLRPIRELHWLARAIQPAVYLAANQNLPANGPTDVRDELQRLAAQARKLCIGLFDISDEAEDGLWQFARSMPAASDDTANAEVAAYQESWERLGGIVAFLDQAAAHAGTRAAAQVAASGPSKKWKMAAEKNWRKWFAVWLSPAFESGFGRTAALDNYAKRGDRYEHGHWADFYGRIMGVAFGTPKPRNLVDVLSEAREIASKNVVLFPPGWFPK